MELDLYDGKAWVGLTPFRMTDIRARGMPHIPGLNRFLEMNLRTYVRTPPAERRPLRDLSREHGAPGSQSDDVHEKPGIYFFSLDASSLAAVIGARTGFGFPYRWAEMKAELHFDGSLHYTSRRRRRSEPAEVELNYNDAGGVIEDKTALELFLTERYAAYEDRLGMIFRTDIHHIPWPLQPATATFARNTVGQARKIPLTLTPDLLHISRRLDVLVFPPVLVR